MVLLRLGSAEDIPQIKKIADSNKRYLGFTVRAIISDAITKGELHVATLEAVIIGFVRWHKRRDGWVTIYEIVVDDQFRKQGVGRMLMRVIEGSPARLKCHSKNPATDFYHRLGFETISTELSRGGKQLEILTRR